MTNYQYPWQVISPRETDRIDSSWTVVFLSRSQGPNRISHETKDLLTMKSSQVGEWDRTAGCGHGRRVKKTAKMGEKEKIRMSKRERERGGRTRGWQKTRDESREAMRESRSAWQWGVGWSEPSLLSACQPVSPRTLASWRPRTDSHTDASCRGRTTRPYRTRIVTTRERYFVCMWRARPARDQSSERVLGTLRGLHAAVISRGITPVNSERFHQDLLKVAFGQGYIYKPRLVRFLIMTSIIAILRYGDQ